MIGKAQCPNCSEPISYHRTQVGEVVRCPACKSEARLPPLDETSPVGWWVWAAVGVGLCLVVVIIGSLFWTERRTSLAAIEPHADATVEPQGEPTEVQPELPEPKRGQPKRQLSPDSPRRAPASELGISFKKIKETFGSAAFGEFSFESNGPEGAVGYNEWRELIYVEPESLTLFMLATEDTDRELAGLHSARAGMGLAMLLNDRELALPEWYGALIDSETTRASKAFGNFRVEFFWHTGKALRVTRIGSTLPDTINIKPDGIRRMFSKPFRVLGCDIHFRLTREDADSFVMEDHRTGAMLGFLTNDSKIILAAPMSKLDGDEARAIYYCAYRIVRTIDPAWCENLADWHHENEVKVLLKEVITSPPHRGIQMRAAMGPIGDDPDEHWLAFTFSNAQ